MQRRLPQADLAEQNVLASIFLDPRLIVTAADLLSPDDFFNKNNARIFQAMVSLYNVDKDIDFVSVGEYFNQNPKVPKVPITYIQTIAASLPSADSFETYISIVLDAAMKRAMIKIAGDIAEIGYTQNINAADYVDYAEKLVFDLGTMRRTSDFQEVGVIAKSYYEKTELNKTKGRQVTGLDTGYQSLNNVTTGFHPEELIIVAARPGMGKSAFAINLALNISKPTKPEEQKHVALFSLEMSNEQIVGRMLSNLSGIDNMKLRTGRLSPKEWSHLSIVVNQLSGHSIFFDDSAVYKVGDLRAKCRKLRQEGKLDIIIIDYLQLLSSDNKNSNRQETVSEISRSLKQLAKELSVPIIALSQLSRNVEHRKGDDKRPVLSDLRESGSIEQDADIVIFLHSEDYYRKDDQEPSGLIDIMIAKNRQGMSGIDLKFTFARNQSRFFPVADREN